MKFNNNLLDTKKIIMNANKYMDLIIYLSTDWKSYTARAKGYFGDIPFIKALSKLPRTRILCVNRPFTPVETTVKKKLKTIEWIKGTRLEKITENLFLYTPFAFIHEMLAVYSPLLQWMNRAVLSKQIKRQLEVLGFNSSIRVSWIYHPLQYTYFGLADENFKVYKCWDLYEKRAYPAKLKEVIVTYERMILQECNVVFTPCINLYKKLSNVSRTVHFTPAGVDFQVFGNSLNESLPMPEDILRINSPRIGFLGNINEKVDISLIRFLAESHPEWAIIMLGSITGNSAFLSSEDYILCKILPNIHFLGFKEFEMLPSYIKCLDVCMLAHSNIESMQYAHPYKTLQYLASGKPVVSTNFPDAYYYKDVIKIARSHKEFASIVEEILNDNSEEACKKRIDFVKRNTWDKRANDTYEILENLIKSKI